MDLGATDGGGGGRQEDDRKYAQRTPCLLARDASIKAPCVCCVSSCDTIQHTSASWLKRSLTQTMSTEEREGHAQIVLDVRSMKPKPKSRVACPSLRHLIRCTIPTCLHTFRGAS